MNNQVLFGALEALLGPDPAVVEMHTMATSYPSEGQGLHQDTTPDASAAVYARSFVSSYSILVPLQDTTEDMVRRIAPGAVFGRQYLTKLWLCAL